MSKFTITHEGVEVFVAVSPWVWMYPVPALGFRMTLVGFNAPNIACVFQHNIPHNRTHTENDLPIAKIRRLARAWLAANGLQPLRDAQAELLACDAKYAALREQRAREAEAKLADMKAQGFTHRFTGVIHRNGGHDQMVEAFTVGEPTKRQISSWLRGSVVKNQFHVSAL